MRNQLALITGVNGHLGSTLARLLAKEGFSVRGLLRAGSRREAIEGIPLEVFIGDVRDRASIGRALQGVEALFHLAAPPVVRTAEDRLAITEGTRNVFELVRETPSVKKAVYISSSVTVGLTRTPQAVLNEQTSQRLTGTAYQEAKWDAETWLKEFLHAHPLPVVIANPSTIVGPGNFSPTPPSRLILDFLNYAGTLDWLREFNLKAAPVYFDSGFSVVDVEDVARGILLAYRKGRVGERYLLGGDNVTLYEFYRTLSGITGLPAPWLYIPRPVMYALSYMLTCLMAHPPMSYRLAKTMVGHYAFFSSEKAARELGYSPRPSQAALERAVEWFCRSPLVRESRKKVLLRLAPGSQP